MRLNGTGDVIDAHQYPATSAELIHRYGDRIIELQTGDETLGEVLERLGQETFYGPQDVYDSVFSAVSHKAIGRRFYSDRDPTTFGEGGPAPVSF